jgi:hypothetical protein
VKINIYYLTPNKGEDFFRRIQTITKSLLGSSIIQSFLLSGINPCPIYKHKINSLEEGGVEVRISNQGGFFFSYFTDFSCEVLSFE